MQLPGTIRRNQETSLAVICISSPATGEPVKEECQTMANWIRMLMKGKLITATVGVVDVPIPLSRMWHSFIQEVHERHQHKVEGPPL